MPEGNEEIDWTKPQKPKWTVKQFERIETMEMVWEVYVDFIPPLMVLDEYDYNILYRVKALRRYAQYSKSRIAILSQGTSYEFEFWKYPEDTRARIWRLTAEIEKGQRHEVS